MKNWRIGAVSYLNSKPLVFEIQRWAAGAKIVYDLPSRLAEMLSDGQLDVALIPSIEAFQHPEYKVLSDACIACCGPVWSVKLLSRTEPEKIQSLSLDEGSRTSVALVQILLKERYGIRPELHRLSIDDDWRTSPNDAVLIIGDRAMWPKGNHRFAHQIDLGAWWHQWSGLPFVFAMWVANLDESRINELSELDQIITKTRDRGLDNLSQIASHCAKEYGLSTEQCLSYFQDFLHFRLGEDERKGLAMFRELASQMELAPKSLQLQFHDC